MARVASFADIADEFERRWKRTVWATMATVGAERRLQSRLVHPLWERDDRLAPDRPPIAQGRDT